MVRYRVRKRGKYINTASALVLLLLSIIMIVLVIRSVGSFTDPLASVSKSNSAVPVKFRIVIDAGHGGKDPGATGASGANEKDSNLSLAHRVNELLRQDSMFETKMTRTDDQFIELEERAELANEWKADAIISLHGNTYEDQEVSGTETIYFKKNSLALAQTLQKGVSKALDTRDRGVKQDQYIILSTAQVPAVIVESGYITNPKEEEMLLSDKGQETAANAIHEALKKYFNGKQPSHQTVSSPDLQDQQKIEKTIYYNGSDKDEKQVALTFDDGPDRIVTPKILKILKEHDVKATFFLLGNKAEANPDIVKLIAEDGHIIGNHSWSHPDFKNLSAVEMRQEIEDTQTLLEEIVGYRPTLFRPPYGSLGKEKLEQIHEMNLAVVNWSVDTTDWSGTPSEDILELVRQQLFPGGIILQHTSNGKNQLANTIEALEKMIPELKDKGYSYVTIPDLLQIPAFQSE
ncbi:polysaccharide deacetylase [Paenibacillus herberti]|uniref:Polysaccharide deacetylase n=2 Tax=Paenibacillus herberti TaxID=1619309 RepID=A0A229P243_9BACL|nr:N-acetylmuramoyl-L-alanine amidase [Paenibacillus herberti]OXM16356.1 polysaccharide deacetylase [Paenibacillus herberti]